MAKEPLNFGEAFTAHVTRKVPSVKPQPRHYWIGWTLILALLGGGAYGIWGGHKQSTLEEKPGFKEMLGHKFGGVLYYDIIRAQINLPKEWDIAAQAGGMITGHKRYEQTHFGPINNNIPNAAETALRDCLGGTGTPTCTVAQAWKYHGLGTSATAVAETDTGCTTELTTQYNPDSTRATGSQTNNGANIYRTVGTNTVDGAATVEEFCLMSAASAGTIWTHILTGTVSLSASDSLQTTYDLTIE